MMLSPSRPLSAVLLLFLCSCASTPSRPTQEASGAPAASTVVLLVRHAEKAGGEDPPLTEEGRRRAEALVPVAERAGVSAIYSTPLRRTQQTAQPLAARLGLPLTLREAGPAQVEALARELRTSQQGHTVLVVGHSNTLPALAEALTGTAVPPIADMEYDRLMVVLLPPSGPGRLVLARYGAPSAP